MKKLIRLTESDLHRIVKESVRTILRETNSKVDELTMEYVTEDGGHRRR